MKWCLWVCIEVRSGQVQVECLRSSIEELAFSWVGRDCLFLGVVMGSPIVIVPLLVVDAPQIPECKELSAL